MFELIKKVKTKDGKLFDSERQAEAYVTDAVCEEINEWIKGTETYDLKHRDLCAILLELAGSKEKLLRLSSLLDRYM